MNPTILGFDTIAFWIVITGILVSVSGALLGNFLVLRRMSLLGDAISHAVLPGLAISFVIMKSRDPIFMLVGALVAGLVTVLLTEMIRKYAKVAEDSAMGVVFTSMFALGVVIISRVASQVDLDPGCVLYGILESAPIDTFSVAGFEMPRIVATMGMMTLAILLFITVFWKELKIVSFDPALATTLGINATVIHYLLMGMVAAFTVSAFEAVGSILVVAMLVVPAATAYLLTDRLWKMVIISAVVGILTALLGRWSAMELETSVAGMMAVSAGVLFTAAVFFSPSHGYLARILFQVRMGLRIVREDILGMLYRWREMSPENPMEILHAKKALGGGLVPWIAITQLRLQGKVNFSAGTVDLSDVGMQTGDKLIAGHRLWESYLNRHFNLPADHLHEPAHRMEHFIGPKMLDEIAKEVDYPDTDPHGRPIRHGNP